MVFRGALKFPDNFAPPVSQEFVLATAGSISGSFANASSGTVATTPDGRYAFKVFYGAGSPSGANQIVLKEISELIPPVLSLPDNITVEATALLTPVPFVVSATDNIDGPVTAIASLTINGPAITSPHAFPIGTTTVFVRASDSRNNRADGQFTVTVQDTTHPVLTAPVGPITASTTNINGIAVGFATSATDLPGAPAPVVVALPASGSVFPLGTTTVTATDHVGLQTIKTFQVVVTGLPDIGVQFIGGAEIPEGSGSIVFGETPALTPASPRSLTIRNDGAAPLKLAKSPSVRPMPGISMPPLHPVRPFSRRVSVSPSPSASLPPARVRGIPPCESPATIPTRPKPPMTSSCQGMPPQHPRACPSIGWPPTACGVWRKIGRKTKRLPVPDYRICFSPIWMPPMPPLMTWVPCWCGI